MIEAVKKDVQLAAIKASIRKIAKEEKLSLFDLAFLAETEPTTLYSFLYHKKVSIRLKTLLEIAGVLGYEVHLRKVTVKKQIVKGPEYIEKVRTFKKNRLKIHHKSDEKRGIKSSKSQR